MGNKTLENTPSQIIECYAITEELMGIDFDLVFLENLRDQIKEKLKNYKGKKANKPDTIEIPLYFLNENILDDIINMLKENLSNIKTIKTEELKIKAGKL